MTNKTGILYVATSPSGRRYVGITTQSMRRRWAGHVHAATHGGRSRFSKAIRKYGADEFSVRVLLRASWGYLNWIEPRVIEAYGTRSPQGYNLREGGSQSRPHAETREKMRQAKLGTKHSAETRAKMSVARKGRAIPVAQAAAVKANTGAKRTPEQRERMRQAALRRAPASAEARENMRQAALRRWARERSS